MFKSAAIDEVIAANPVQYERRTLPKKVDKDPTRRHQAIYRLLPDDHEVDYYESRQPGLGDQLDVEIEAVFALIRRFPQAAVAQPTRPPRRGTRSVPFTLPYQIVGGDIVILALAHTSRAPGYWTRVQGKPLKIEALLEALGQPNHRRSA